MHIFPNTDTRIINYRGTIIIISSFNPHVNQYRVFIDGVTCGFLYELDGKLYPVAGTHIKPVFLEQIHRLVGGVAGASKKTG